MFSYQNEKLFSYTSSLGLGGTKMSSSIVDDLISTVCSAHCWRKSQSYRCTCPPASWGPSLLLAAVQQGYPQLVDKGLSITSLTLAKLSNQGTGFPIIIPDITLLLGPPSYFPYFQHNFLPLDISMPFGVVLTRCLYILCTTPSYLDR